MSHFRRHIVIAAGGIKSCCFLLVLSSTGAIERRCPPQPALGKKGPWCRNHDPYHTTSSRNLLCPVSHLLCVPAWHLCCRHSLRFTPLIASYRYTMADCSHPCQTRPSQGHLRNFPIMSCALDLQSAELAPDSPGVKTLTPNCCLPTAE